MTSSMDVPINTANVAANGKKMTANVAAVLLP